MSPTRREFLFSVAAAISPGAEQSLLQQWQAIARQTDGTVGAAAMHIATRKLVSMNGNEPFPLASVCKIPVAMHMLALVDERKFSIDQNIEVFERDVWPGVGNIATRWPAQREFPLGELIVSMISKSDNTAVEALYRIGGGASAVGARLRQWKVDGVRIDRTERECTLDLTGVEHYPPPEHWRDAELNDSINKVPPASRYQAALRFLRDPRDKGTPTGTANLLGRVFRGELLSPTATAFLIDALRATTTFPTRLKGALPTGTVVAHKTGSWGEVKDLNIATNDSGVIFLPDGNQLAVSVYIKASTRNDAIRDQVIARIARAAFDASAK
jgi:beta-lactamase class A